MLPKTIKGKMTLVVACVFSALVILFAVLALSTYRVYTKLQLRECRSIIHLERERANASIHLMHQQVRQLALAGMAFQRAGEHPIRALKNLLGENLRIGSAVDGGGIWFEPYATGPDRELVAAYAYFAGDRHLVYDDDFLLPKSRYLDLPWYKSLSAELRESPNRIDWTSPFHDIGGTKDLIVTAGCAMHDAEGRFIGIATIDNRVNSILKRISSIRPTPNTFVLIADPEEDLVRALSNSSIKSVVPGQALSKVDWYTPFAGSQHESEIRIDGERYFSFSIRLENDMLFAINIPVDELFQDIYHRLRLLVLALVVGGLMSAGLVYLLLNRFVNRPVARLTRSVAKLGAGDLDAQVDLDSRDELGNLAVAFNVMARDLKDHIHDLNLATAERERIAAELGMASKIQAAMLPTLPQADAACPYRLHAVIRPAKVVGGDLYDIFPLGSDRVAAIIADVSGKGMPAALFMVVAQTLLRQHARLGQDPETVFARTNAGLCENNKTSMFVTACMLVLNLRTGEARFVNAGHTPPLIRRAGGNFSALPVRPCLPLGVRVGKPFPTENLCLQPGDSLLLYTDGVTEAENPAGAFFGTENLLAAADRHSLRDPVNPETLLTGLLADIDAFAASAPQADDITMLGLVYDGPPSGPANPID